MNNNEDASIALGLEVKMKYANFIIVCSIFTFIFNWLETMLVIHALVTSDALSVNKVK